MKSHHDTGCLLLPHHEGEIYSDFFLSIMKGSVIVLLGIITLRFAGSGRDCGRGWKCLNHAHTIVLLLTTTLAHDMQLYKPPANCGYPSLVPSSFPPSSWSWPVWEPHLENMKCKGKNTTTTFVVMPTSSCSTVPLTNSNHTLLTWYIIMCLSHHLFHHISVNGDYTFGRKESTSWLKKETSCSSRAQAMMQS